jgi:phospholipase/carboxylesterase
MSAEGPHAGQPVERTGPALAEADAAVVMAHGRGARARGMLGFADDLDVDGVAYLAPQAQRGTWYPNRFVAPIESNEPHLSSALATLDGLREEVADAGIPAERTVFLGFSQGACLSSEYVARKARRYGGLAVLSGGLVGPEGEPLEYEGDLAGTPAFLGCDREDPHIPEGRVEESAAVLEEMGADVDLRLYDGLGHGVNEDELDAVRDIVADAADR